jgi:hypothetical protein
VTIAYALSVLRRGCTFLAWIAKQLSAIVGGARTVKFTRPALTLRIAIKPFVLHACQHLSVNNVAGIGLTVKFAVAVSIAALSIVQRKENKVGTFSGFKVQELWSHIIE